METDRTQLFSDLKTELFKRQLSNSENFDKAILTYASGALALSLAFLKDFVPLASAHNTWLLYLSWFSFAFCIVVTVASYLVSQLGITRQLELAERYYLKNEDTAFAETNRAAKATDYFNTASGIMFCIAVLLTTVFIALNAKDASMSHKDHLFEGAPIPALQKTIINNTVEKGTPVPKITPVPGQTPPITPSKPDPAQTGKDNPRK